MHTHTAAHAQLMGVGRAEMGVVSLLLPGCCHGDADGACTASWDCHFAINYTNAPAHTLTPLLIDAGTCTPFESSLPSELLSSNRKKVGKRKGLTFSVCVRT